MSRRASTSASSSAICKELLGHVRHGSLAEIELGQILTGMARIAARHGVRLPASLSLAGKALAQVQLTAAQLDPELQPVELIGRFVARSLTRDLARHGDPRVALYELQKLRVRARRLLEGLERVTGARPGPGLQVEVRGLAELERSVRRMTIAIAAAALAAAIALVVALVAWLGVTISAARAGARSRFDRRGCARATARAGS